MSLNWNTSFNITNLRLASGRTIRLTVPNRKDTTLTWEYMRKNQKQIVVNKSGNIIWTSLHTYYEGVGAFIDQLLDILTYGDEVELVSFASNPTPLNMSNVDKTKAYAFRIKLANNISLVYRQTDYIDNELTALSSWDSIKNQIYSKISYKHIYLAMDSEINNWESISGLGKHSVLLASQNYSTSSYAYSSSGLNPNYFWQGTDDGISIGLSWSATDNAFYTSICPYKYLGQLMYIDTFSISPTISIADTTLDYPNTQAIFGSIQSGSINNLKTLLDLVYAEDSFYSDPYSEFGGESTTGGGNGTDIDISDNIPIPDLPTESVTSAGFVTLYCPTATQLKSLGNVLWTSDIFDNFKRDIFGNPFDCIVGLTKIPCPTYIGATQNLKLGNTDTGVSMALLRNPYIDVNCGTVNIRERWGAYMDYNPYTKIEIYLPYIGVRTLDTDLVMNKSISVKYRVECSSGACCCMIGVNGSVLYQYNGSVGAQIPINSSDWSNVISSILGGIATVGGAAIMHASAPVMVGAALGSVSNVAQSKMTVSHGSENMSGNNGWLGIQYPYIIISRPNQCVPANQNEMIGYPNYMGVKLSSLSGYTEIESLRCNNFRGTETEYNELVGMLKGGVII